MDQAIAELFELAFDEDDIVVELADEDALFTRESLGTVQITTGTLIAGDPFHLNNDTLLSESFPLGEFPVEAAIAEFEDGEEVIGYVRVRFSSDPPEDWEPAQYGGENAMMSTLITSGIYGLGDVSVLRHLRALDNEQREAVDEALHYDLHENYRENRSWATRTFDGHDLIVCSAGDGEGTYTSYIGRDKDGNICRLLTDFALFEEDSAE